MGILATIFIQKDVICSLLGFVTTPIIMTVSNHTVTLPAININFKKIYHSKAVSYTSTNEYHASKRPI